MLIRSVHPLRAACKVAPISAGLLATRMPAASRAAILSDGLARAARDDRAGVAHPLARRGGLTGDERGQRLGELARRLERGGLLLGVAADLAHHQHAVGLGVGLEERERVDEARAVDRVAADADAGALADAQVRELPDALVSERSRPADDADAARLVDIARHDADLARPGRDDPGAVGADQPGRRVMRLQVSDGADHVEHGDALGDRDDHLDAGVGRFHDRVGRERGRHEDHGGVGAGRRPRPRRRCRRPGRPAWSSRPARA